MGMGWGRAIMRCLLGAFLAAFVGSVVSALVLVLGLMLARATQAPSESWPTFVQLAAAFWIYVRFAAVIVGLPALVVGIPIWFGLDRFGLRPRRGLIAGAVFGLVFGVPFVHLFTPICVVVGAIAGWGSVKLVNRWLPAEMDAP
ncbi:hypothetical protein DLJ53_14685 [Acuticoccus sediminis]|uniref:Uncharacterized protein n=2 Tax=Acuticoccus sediminis TaxID=2184697 RepID=A0A8B2NQ97_9HYPH|nr:hypothetical protein DLJ53_14685 [Acuticoccus sediminis]